ncbi:MAG: hypothetical protein IJV35_04385 [Neisseriaceae bacterium]|nr:hypothetical protein [Neisseriaceae bacterium]
MTHRIKLKLQNIYAQCVIFICCILKLFDYIISGSLKLFMNLVVTTPAALIKNLRFFTGLPRQAFRLGS